MARQHEHGSKTALSETPHRPEQVEALIAQAAGRIDSLGTGESTKLAKYLRNRVPGLVPAQESVLPPSLRIGWLSPVRGVKDGNARR